ncbi:MAG: hypothetical protein IPJ19_18165 [Planctomycetes bacterium]|nr:hypothetical protein [Planctomycetota bacterium]
MSTIAGQHRHGSSGIHTGKWFAAVALAIGLAACSGGGSSSPGAAAPRITYTGPTAWSITGPQGGPFSNTSMDIPLQNLGEDPIDWTASSVPAYVQLDLAGGTLAPNTQTTVHATLNTGMAQSLSTGANPGLLAFHNDTSAQADIEIDCNLSVTDPSLSVQVDPPTSFMPSGPAGGPFVPAATVYTITNTGTGSLNWETVTGDSWATASPSSGSLASGASVDVTVGVNQSMTTGFSPGIYWSYFDVRNATDHATFDSRDIGLGVTPGTTSTGWTTFTPSSDSRLVFVSNSGGNDSNNGLSESAPKRTIAAGKALMRNGFPDWLLLKCGDTWDEAIGTWSNSGRSMSEPTLISSYGTGDRPFLRTGLETCVVPAYLTNPNYVSIVGLHFKANLYNGSNGSPSGVNWIRHTDGFLLEDCYIERYSSNVIIQEFNETNGNQPPNRHTNVRIRRNIISECYNCVNTGGSSGVSSNGLFVYNCDGILIEENVFDHNGTVDSIPGAIPIWFRHNGYVCNGNTGVALRGNIVYGTDSVMMRCGGDVENNLYLENYNAVLYGLGIEPESAGVTGTVRDNVVLDARDYGDGTGGFVAGGLAIDMGNVAQSVVDNNIFAHNVHGSSPRPLQIHDDHNYNSYRVVDNTTISNNIFYDWGGTCIDINTSTGGQSQQPHNLQFLGNILENTRDNSPLVHHTVSASLAGVTGAGNTFNSMASTSAWFQVNGANESLTQWKASLAPPDTTSTAAHTNFPDPNRTIATYMTSLGGSATMQAFIAQCRLQSKATWNPMYTADAVNTYIRAGFGR